MQRADKRALTLRETSQLKCAVNVKSELALVEAALYVAGRPVSLDEVCSVLRTSSKSKVKRVLRALIREYVRRDTALEILELEDERYVMQLKAEFTQHVKKLIKRPLLSVGPLKTLSYIAFKQPIPQKRVVEVRGQRAYSHIKLLKEMGLIASEKSGRTTILRTTDHFADYFGLSHNISAMKRELKKVLKGKAMIKEGA